MSSDFERMEWLARSGQSVRRWENGGMTLVRWSGRKHERPKILRQQIDAAMAAEARSSKEAAVITEHNVGGFGAFLRARL